MARRKNVKRIDPRYFLNETVNRGEELEEPAEAEETALNSPREAGRQWAVENLAVAVDSALGSGLNNTEIRAIVDDNLPEDNWRGNKNPFEE